MESSLARAHGRAGWLTKQVVVQPVSGSEMVVLSGRRTLKISTDGSLDPSAAWRLLQEGSSVDAAAAALGCEASLMQTFVEQLQQADLLVPRGEGGAADEEAVVERDSAVELIGDSATMWKRHSLVHPLFSLLEDDTPRPALAQGLLVETCHYARLFPFTIAKAATNLDNPDAAARLAAFAEEEMPHYEEMARSLAAYLDVAVADIVSSRPSPSLQLLLALLDQAAGADPCALASVLALVEMNDAPAEPSADAFMALADSNELPRELFAPFGDHAREDGALAHGQVASEVVAASLPEEVETGRLDGILNFVHDVKHGFDLLYDQLVSRWAEPDQHYTLRGSVEWRRL
jgi:hypothetical protein